MTSNGEISTLSDYHEELPHQGNTEGSSPETGLSKGSNFSSELRDFSFGSDTWTSTSSVWGDFEVNSDTDYSRITMNNSYSDASDGSYDVYTKSDLEASSSSHQDILDANGDPTGDSTSESSDYAEHLLQGTISIPETGDPLAGISGMLDANGDPVTTHAIEQHSFSSGTGLYEVITQAFDVDEDGTIEEGEQQATIRLEADDDYRFGTGIGFLEDGTPGATSNRIFNSFSSDSGSSTIDTTDPEIRTKVTSTSLFDETGFNIPKEHGYHCKLREDWCQRIRNQRS